MGKKKKIKYTGQTGDDFIKLLLNNYPDRVKVFKDMDDFEKRGKDEFFDDKKKK